MVMRQEFKRMMRETRAEGVRLLKVSGYAFIYTHTWNDY
jgi:LAS superfamily LD-carboxypeptidase LdcB